MKVWKMQLNKYLTTLNTLRNHRFADNTFSVNLKMKMLPN